jgi:uncharacterized membrane protein YwaF
MLQMCGLSILFLPVMFLSERQKTRQLLSDILYFWGIGGALQALITLDIGTNGFRHCNIYVSSSRTASSSPAP